MVDGWKAKTPESFVVAAKFPRSIVHAGTSTEPDAKRLLTRDATYEDRDEFLEVMARLEGRLGPLLLQFPYFATQAFASQSAFFERLERFLEELPRSFSYAVEIRNPEWVDTKFAALCRRHDAALVLVDRAGLPHGRDLAATLDTATAPFNYVRLLGDRQHIERITTRWNREVIDHRDSLERWAELLAWMDERNVPTWVFTNNHYAGHAPTTVRRLQRYFQVAREQRAKRRSDNASDESS